MKLEKTSLLGVYKIYYDHYVDERGEINNLHSFHPDSVLYKEDKLTISKKNVLRGLHGDLINDKLIYCIKGSFKLVVVNYDKEHKEYSKSEIFKMSDVDKYCLFVPRKYLNAHYCLEDSYFFYRWTHGYIEPEKQISVRWDSFGLKKTWEIREEDIILSKRDKDSLLIS